MGFIALLMVPISLGAAMAGTEMHHWNDAPWRDSLLAAYGIYSVIAGLAGIIAGLNMVRSRHLALCCVGASMVVGTGVLSLFLDVELVAIRGIYVLFLALPAAVMLVAARAAFGDGLEVPTSGPVTIPPLAWPPPPATVGSPPPPVPAVQTSSASDPVHRFVPPSMQPPTMPPLLPFPNPPRLLFLKDVGRARAVRAGILMTVSAAVLTFFGVWGLVFPHDYPGLRLGIIALIGSYLGLAGAYYALVREHKGLAIGLAMSVLACFILLVMYPFSLEGGNDYLILLPLLALGAVVLVSTVLTYKPWTPPFYPPSPTSSSPPPLNVRGKA